MQVTAILKARAVALIYIDELNLSGRLRFPDIVSPLVEKYGFLTYPTKPEEFDPEKGIKFGSGKSGDKVIDLLALYTGIISLETLSSTADSRHVLEDVLKWGAEKLGLTYRPASKVIVGHDPTARKNAIAGITIEHRIDVPFGENRFFSEAPLPTDLHIRFLEELEADALESLK